MFSVLISVDNPTRELGEKEEILHCWEYKEGSKELEMPPNHGDNFRARLDEIFGPVPKVELPPHAIQFREELQRKAMALMAQVSEDEKKQ